LELAEKEELQTLVVIEHQIHQGSDAMLEKQLRKDSLVVKELAIKRRELLIQTL